MSVAVRELGQGIDPHRLDKDLPLSGRIDPYAIALGSLRQYPNGKAKEATK